MSLCPHTGCNYPEGDCAGPCLSRPVRTWRSDKDSLRQAAAVMNLEASVAQLRADLREERRQRRRANGWTWVALGLLAAETLLHNVAYYLLG